MNIIIQNPCLDNQNQRRQGHHICNAKISPNSRNIDVFLSKDLLTFESVISQLYLLHANQITTLYLHWNASIVAKSLEPKIPGPINISQYSNQKFAASEHYFLLLNLQLHVFVETKI